jgi:C1A family cysteine protease
VQSYGWIPDLPDHRDVMFAAPMRARRAVPPRVDLRDACPPVCDQGDLGSCTANAIAAALEFDLIKQQASDVFPASRLFIYYNERAMEGTIDEDAGAMIRDGIKSVSKQGAPHESLWPYTLAKFRTKPSAAAFKDAAKHPAVLYRRVPQDLEQMKTCLASGFPFVFGFSVYDSFESPTVEKTGHAPMPKPKDRMIGGHAVLAVGYDNVKRWFIVRNSWGTRWGMKGYFTMPYKYLLDSDLADDFWTISLVQ